MEAALAKQTLDRSRRDPAWWARHFLGIHLWPKQVEQICAWRDNRRTSFRSCNGIGKSLCNAVAVLYLGSCFEDTLVLTTATTFTQIRGSVWNEIKILLERAKLPLGYESALQTEIRWPHGSRAIGLTAPANDTQKMQGYRGRKRTFVLGDEAGGLSKQILEGMKSMLTGQDTHLLLTGNPIDPKTEFKRTFSPERKSVYKIKVGAFDTPNLRAFGITLNDIVEYRWREKVAGRPYPLPNLITPEWVEEQYEDCSRNVRDPRFIARVLGDFPEDTPDTLIPMPWIEAAFTFGKKPRTEDEIDTPRRLGVDVAWQGDDSSAIASRRGVRVRIIDIMQGQDPMQVTGRTKVALETEGATEANIDEVGIGAGVLSRGRELHLPFIGVHVGRSPNDKRKFPKLRHEVWWNLRELFEQTYRASLEEKDTHGQLIEPGIILEGDDPMLAEELNTPTWALNSSGQIVVEDKDETKKKIKRSPDRADAVGLAFAQPPGWSPAIALDLRGLEQRSTWGGGSRGPGFHRDEPDDDDEEG